MFYKIIFLIIFSVFPFFQICAQENNYVEVEILVDKSFSIGETINFDFKMDINLSELKYISYIDCQKVFPQKFPEELILEEKDIGKYINYSDILVSDDIEQQKCKAVIEVISSPSKIFSKEFEINTKLLIDARLIFCTTSSCEEEARNINNKDSVFLNVLSKASIPFRLEITSENNKVDVISAPTWYIFTESGEYKIEIIANSNYKILDAYSILNVNRIKEYKSASQQPVFINKIKYLYFSIIFFIFLIIFIFIYKKKKIN